MPGIARENDSCTTGHGCSSTSKLDGSFASQSVYANNRKVERKGDITFSHLIGTVSCVSHTAPIKKGSNSVYVNNKPVSRLGDDVDSNGKITSASTNVFVN